MQPGIIAGVDHPVERDLGDFVPALHQLEANGAGLHADPAGLVKDR
ncbi:hypothetical protein [Bradyrhizobium diversitatis]|uniref:Uncharacterized protein n=1 Tax=Bradyrhizobium diversitatis TaxID=2755406 RepID=A0ABS0P0H8_9BRAD|nr:hypothetical protein [Bradyrhizobium diversitatis]MBH5386739.1 hypothetical protein [Bradyrhizobium diversitatis]